MKADNPPTMIGIFGVPGSGKHKMLDALKTILGEHHDFKFFDSSKKTIDLYPGTLAESRRSGDDEKENWTLLALERIKKDCVASGKVGIVAANFMFRWDDENLAAEEALTRRELSFFTHIIHLNRNLNGRIYGPPDDSIFSAKEGKRISAGHRSRWQDAEKTQLRSLCFDLRILMINKPKSRFPFSILDVLHDFKSHSKECNLPRAEKKLDSVVAQERCKNLETMLIFEGDGTLSPDETEEIFWGWHAWENFPKTALEQSYPWWIKTYGPSAYDFKTFRQATLFYDELTSSQEGRVEIVQVHSESSEHLPRAHEPVRKSC